MVDLVSRVTLGCATVSAIPYSLRRFCGRSFVECVPSPATLGPSIRRFSVLTLICIDSGVWPGIRSPGPSRHLWHCRRSDTGLSSGTPRLQYHLVRTVTRFLGAATPLAHVQQAPSKVAACKVKIAMIEQRRTLFDSPFSFRVYLHFCNLYHTLSAFKL